MADALTPDGLRRFGEVAAEHVANGGVPGLVALVARHDQVHVEVHGSLDAGGGTQPRPVRRDSLFRIASTTKPIMGAATMVLIDEGRLTLDGPVDTLLPELAGARVLRSPDGPLDDTVPAKRAITVRDLLTFTFGFGMAMEMFTAPQPWPVVQAANDLHLATLGPPQPQEPPGPDAWMAALGSLPLLAHPGERWLYNTGAQVLGVLAARAAGMPLDDVLRTRLFEPLGMRDTAFHTADTSRLATAYVPTQHGLQTWDPPDGQWSTPPRFPDAAAGLVSTADDLLAFARMLLRNGDGVLSPQSVRAMTTDQLTAEQKAQAGSGILGDSGWAFCQAVVIDGPRTGAYGWAGGLGSTWLVDPHRDIVTIVLCQRLFDSPQPPAVHRELQDAAYAAVA